MGGVGMEDYGIGGACKTGSTGRDCKCLGWTLEWRGRGWRVGRRRAEPCQSFSLGGVAVAPGDDPYIAWSWFQIQSARTRCPRAVRCMPSGQSSPSGSRPPW